MILISASYSTNLKFTMESEHTTLRPALGEFGRLGSFYDARSDRILTQSLLTTAKLPQGCTEEMNLPRFKYQCAFSDIIKEKWETFDISTELGLSILCGMVNGQGNMAYLSQDKTNARIQQASVVCETRTCCQSLFFGNELKAHLDLNALSTQEATHVIWRIDWGAQVFVAAKKTTTDKSGSYDLGIQLGIEPQGDTPVNKKSYLMRIIESIGKSHAGASLQSDSDLKTMATSFEFEINTNVPAENFPTDYDGVVDFIRSVPSRLTNVNGGKGVPITFHLLPISELAKTLRIQVKHSIIFHRLNEHFIDRCIQHLQELETTVRDLANYKSRVEQYRCCIPDSHLKETRKLYLQATYTKNGIKEKLRNKIVSIRGGGDCSADEDDGSDNEVLEDYRSIVHKYVDKIEFADLVINKGGNYLPHDQIRINNFIATSKTNNIYVLEFSQNTQKHPNWILTKKMLNRLLDGKDDASYSVLAVNCDMGETKNLEKARIMRYSGGKIAVVDVVKHEQELEDKCLIKCDKESLVDRSRAVLSPPGRRILRIPCPGKDCFDTGSSKWTCPNCRELVSYGFTDTYMYCRCSRYPASCSVFRCRNNKHGPEYAKYDPDHLHKLLAVLDRTEEYNILILGKTGVGKTMFINVFYSYLNFETLDDAMDYKGPIPYVIPFSFTRGREDGELNEVGVGDETEYEKLSKGQSGTRRTMVYSFHVDDKLIKLIDTPGIGDTEGTDQDQKNADDILGILGTINKLSAVIFLLPPDETRLDSFFKFCITSLFSYLHRDVAKNICFVYNRASSTNYRQGNTCIQVDNILDEFKIDLTRKPSNEFFFDSEGYMYLAAYKQEPPWQWDDKDRYAEMWKKSATETYRMLTTVMRLPAHQLRKTISLNRARRVLEGMVKPLTHFTSVMEESQRNLAAVRERLNSLNIESADISLLVESLKVAIIAPVRYNLASKQLVCSEPSCIQAHTVCCDGCTINAPDGIPGHPSVSYCHVFTRWWSLRLYYGHCCSQCGHTWNTHSLISYKFKDEPLTSSINEKVISRKFRRNKDSKMVVGKLLEYATSYRDNIINDQALVNKKQAEFGVYIDDNSIIEITDPNVKHLDDCIKKATIDNRTTEAEQFKSQKTRDYF